MNAVHPGSTEKELEHESREKTRNGEKESHSNWTYIGWWIIGNYYLSPLYPPFPELEGGKDSQNGQVISMGERYASEGLAMDDLQAML